MAVKIIISIALFEILLLALSLKIGLKTEIELLINLFLIFSLLIFFIMYANRGIFVDYFTYSISKISLYTVLGLLVGMFVSYFIWFFSESSEIRYTDWYPGLVVYGIRLVFGLLSILFSCIIVAFIRRFNFPPT